MKLSALDRLRIRALLHPLIGLLSFPIVGQIMFGGGPFGIVALVVAVAWFMSMVFALNKWENFRCPHCDAAFFKQSLKSKHMFRNNYTNTCIECGHQLPKT